MQMMTIEVTPTIAKLIRALQAKAEKHGIPLEDWLQMISENGIAQTPVEMTAAEKARAWEAWATSHDPKTPVILNDSREMLYEND